MIQTRNNIFETNSSSTHCLLLDKFSNKTNLEQCYNDFLKENYTINITSYTPSTYTTVCNNPLDIITYLYAVYFQSKNSDETYECGDLLIKYLTQLFPNVSANISANGYFYEDCEYLITDGELKPFLESEQKFLAFVFYGIVIFYDRDVEYYCDLVDEYCYSGNYDYIKVTG